VRTDTEASRISVSTLEALLAAGAIDVRQTPGRNPVHGDIIVACDSTGGVPSALLDVIARTFTQRPNPARFGG
jgi:hypothetical protein